MLKVENVEVWGFEHAIRGMRNPLNSWAKSDSYKTHIEDTETLQTADFEFFVGEKDLELMQKLCKAGPEHRKFMRQIIVAMDITAPFYWWAEFDTYKVGVTRNSCSFMHRGVSKPFEITDFSTHDDRIYEILSKVEKEPVVLEYPYETLEFKYYSCENGRKYKVFRNGRVFSCAFEYVDTMGRCRHFDEKECIPSETKNGYFELNLGGRLKEKWLLHRLVAFVWLENKYDHDTVNHIDGNKGNNSVENLEWCSLSDNIKKGFESGLFKNGKSIHAKYRKWKNGHIVVNPIEKLNILKDHERGLTCNQLAVKYNITTSQANNLISYTAHENEELFLSCYAWEKVIETLNSLRDSYLETGDSQVFQQIRCLLPSGYNQRATITMNYENALTIIKQRTGHKLDEWSVLIEKLLELPYLKEIAEL